MKLPKSFTTVTPLSKVLALIIFVLMPFLGFYFGYKYKTLITMVEPRSISQKEKLACEVHEPVRDLTEICGDLPELPIGRDGHFTRVTGPFWSPDCRYIAWAAWQSGAMGISYEGPHKYEGLFVYNYFTKKTNRVYIPKNKQDQETITLEAWQDSDKLIFKKDSQNQLFIYNLVSKTITE